MRTICKHFTSSSLLIPGLIASILGIVYLSTLLPGVGYGGDTAKFQFVGKVLGTPHATGYPTYVILNYLFTTLFPFGTLAYKANLLSCIFSIAAILYFYRLLTHFFELRKGIAFVTCLTFGLTPTLWSQSIVARVYTLHLLWITVVLYHLCQWTKTKKEKHLLFAFASYAFSFGNHITMILFLPAILYWVWVTDKKTFLHGQKIGWAILLIALSALQYSYIFWRFYAPKTSYLEMQAGNLKELWWYLTGGYFKSYLFQFSISQLFFERLPIFLRLLFLEYSYWVLVALWGIFQLRNKQVNIFLILCFLGTIFFPLNYKDPDIFVYFIPTYLIVAIYIGVGLKWTVWVLVKNRFFFLQTLLLLIPLFFFNITFARVDQHGNIKEDEEIKTILQTIKKDGVIISPSYNYSEYFWYYLIGEGIENQHNLYVMHHFNLQDIRSYLYESIPFYLWEERKHVPPGLTMYCMSPYHRDTLGKAGFALSKIRENLYRIER